MDYNIIWFILVGILFAGYAVLDGFDLGVGSLHLFARGDEERRLLINSIGPVWDGNEVWLVTGGGALFAAFPPVYAAVFSGFYEPFMLLLFALIFRAVAIEFRSKEEGRRWRGFWDVAFTCGSVLAAFLIGVAMGNIVWGINLTPMHVFDGTVVDLLHPYALFTGLTTVALFAMHGNIYLILKTEGALQQKVRSWTRFTLPAYMSCFVLFNLMTVLGCPHVEAAIRQRPWLTFSVLVLAVLATLNIALQVYRRREGLAFISSCLSILLLMTLFALAMFPNLVYSVPNAGNSLNIYNGASTDYTLRLMFIIAMIGVPIVCVYMVCIYYIFRGKVKLTEESY